MTARPLPPADYLRQCLSYDPETGELRWKHRPAHMFPATAYLSSAGRAAKWNKAMAGRPAFRSQLSKGYLTGKIGDHRCYAHRVIWKMMTGEEPPAIDHINGITSDNRFANLAAATYATNNRNAARRITNTSGVTGVSFDRKRNRWRAYIDDEGRRPLGYFVQIEDAVRARKAAERELGFHPNHDRVRPHTRASTAYYSSK